jgi:tetratricopeptide (TPR) repeat protein
MSDDVFSIKESDELIQKGKEAWDQKKYERAYEAWSEALAADPNRKKDLEKWLTASRHKVVRIRLEKGRRYEEAGEEEQAIEAYRSALEVAQDMQILTDELNERIRHIEARATVMQHALKVTIVVAGLILLAGIILAIVSLSNSRS